MSVSLVESSLSTLSYQVSNLEKCMEEAEGRISVTEDGCGMVQHSPPWRRQWNSSAGKWMMENQVWHKNLKIVNFPEKAEEAPPLGASSSHCYHFWSACPPTFPRWRLNALIAHLHQTQPQNKPSRSILVQFLQYSQREGIPHIFHFLA